MSLRPVDHDPPLERHRIPPHRQCLDIGLDQLLDLRRVVAAACQGFRRQEINETLEFVKLALVDAATPSLGLETF